MLPFANLSIQTDAGRGTVGAYARWAELVGDDSYLYENMQPYFEKSVHFSTSNLDKRVANASVNFNADSYSTSGGPLQVSYPSYAGPFSTCKAMKFRHQLYCAN